MGSTEPFWIEINISQLRKNIKLIQADMPKNLRLCSVLKNQAYGHGAVKVAQEMVAAGSSQIAVSTLQEAMELKNAKIHCPILIFGERTSLEIESCIENDFIFFVNDSAVAEISNTIAKKHGKKVEIQIEVDTGLSRYGVRWDSAVEIIESIAHFSHLNVTGVMTHFAMSDELDKTFANEQIRRFDECIEQIRKNKKIAESILFHASNTGGFLDLPTAHYDQVRIGILPLGIYPSKVCRRIEGIKPILEFKSRVASIKNLHVGDVVGYGMHYKATSTRTIAVLPMGYGTGFPRLRNQGYVLICGKRAPIVGGNAMNAMMVDVTDIAETKRGDEVILIGRQGEEQITAVDVASWCGTVCYDILTRLSLEIPRIYKN